MSIIFKHSLCNTVVLLLLVSSYPFSVLGSTGSGGGERPSSAAENVAFLVFDANPSASYDVSKNGNPLASATSSISGILEFSDLAAAGDSYSFLIAGSNPLPPSKPVGFSVSSGELGCAQCDWIRNPETNVVNYRIYFGMTSGAQSGVYADSVDTGDYAHYKLCGLNEGTYYFALRAINSFGLMSELSTEVSAYITAGNTQAPSPPQQVSVTEQNPGCARITWAANSEPDLAGYMVYYGTLSRAGGQTQYYADSTNVGLNALADICGLSSGTYYFAVRAYNASGLFSAYSTEKSLVLTGVDASPPAFSDLSPPDGATGVPLNAMIAFSLSDAGNGVDTNSVRVRINGAPPASVKFMGGPGLYSVSCRAQQLFSPGSSVTVAVAAADLSSPANEDSVSWTFTTGTTGDVDPPVFCCLNPPDGSVGVDRFTDIVIGISDPGAGVNLASVELTINGIVADFVKEGDGNKDIVIRYRNTEGFYPNSTVSVTVKACDLSNPSNCSNLGDYSFTVGSSQEPSNEVAIVPDGFWAEDPERPMEVRNIPLGWTVRIFNTAGTQVRTFKNTIRSGYNWLWDFTNDRKRKVTRSLYLVRITDSEGRVRRSGRFLVRRVP